MDRGAALSILGLLLIIAVLVNTFSFYGISNRWQVDTTVSIVNTGRGSIRNIIKPPDTKIIGYGGESIIVLENLSRREEDMLFAEGGFENALGSEDRLVLYTSESGLNAVIASRYFNEAEVRMLSIDDRVTKPLKSTRAPGMMNISHIEVFDPTNAKIEWVEMNGSLTPILIPHNMNSSYFWSSIAGSAEFKRTLEGSMKLSKKSLLLYRPSNSDMSIIIPVKFSENQMRMLAKNSAVKTALEFMDAGAGGMLNLEETREFQDIDMANLPYEPNTRIYTSFDIRSELGFVSEDVLIYLAIFVVILVIFYVLYTILIA